MAPDPVRQAPKDDIVKGVYGPTRQNDTLWAIAEKAGRPYKVSVEQMMVAIYQANPKAFYKDNVNALLAKVKLKFRSAKRLSSCLTRKRWPNTIASGRPGRTGRNPRPPRWRKRFRKRKRLPKNRSITS